MRNIKKIIVHCTDTLPTATVADLMEIFRRNGWKNPGYHRVVNAQGSVVSLLDDEQIANGVRGHNTEAIHIAYIGGKTFIGANPSDTRTAEQANSINRTIHDLLVKYPAAKLMGHCELNPHKACPCYNVKESYALWRANNISSTS